MNFKSITTMHDFEIQYNSAERFMLWFSAVKVNLSNNNSELLPLQSFKSPLVE